MRHALHIACLLAAVATLLTACRHYRYPPDLLRADSLCASVPDSALALLHRLRGDTAGWPLHARMRYRLVCVKATDKADRPLTTDSVLLPALRYYAYAHGDPACLPEALYYGGRVYRELGDADLAQTCLDRAATALPDGADDGLKSNVYSQLGQLFVEQDMYPEARAAFRASLACDLRTGDSLKLVFAYRDIAFCFRSEEQTDSARHYYDRARQVARLMGGGYALRVVQVQRAGFLLQTGQTDSAWTALRPYFHPARPGKPFPASIFIIASKLYWAAGQADSAIYCARAVLGHGTLYARRDAYRLLGSYAASGNDKAELEQFWQGYIRCADSIRQTIATESLRKANAIGDIERHRAENRRLKALLGRNQLLSWALACGIAATSLWAVVLWRRGRRRRQTRPMPASTPGGAATPMPATPHTPAATPPPDVPAQAAPSTAAHEHDLRLRTSPVYQAAKQAASQGKPLPPDKQNELQRALAETYARCAAVLADRYSVRDDKLYLCLLLKARFTLDEIAALRCVNPGSVRMSFKRLSKKMWPADGTYTKLKELIYSL